MNLSHCVICVTGFKENVYDTEIGDPGFMISVRPSISLQDKKAAFHLNFLAHSCGHS